MRMEVQAVLATNDIRRLKSFYGEVFGAEETMRVPAKGRPFFVSLELGSSVLTLVANKRGADAKPGRAILAVSVASVDDLLARITAAGGKVQAAPKDMPWGHRVAHVTDPDGNPINVTQRL